MKKLIAKLFAVFVLVMLTIAIVLVALRMNERPRTDDAVLVANIANIAPDVSGRIISLPARNNQSVHVGEVLFVIDPEPYRLKLNAAKAGLKLASATLERIEPLLGKGYITAERIDEARAAKENARALEALANRDLINTTVVAPFSGKIAGLNIAVGEYAVAGHPLFTLIDTSKWYVVANFRETEIARMRPGANASVYIMAQPQKALPGHVDSVGWGVRSENAGLESGLPNIPKSLNWVRLAQRFPVRILLDNPPENLMRIGASAVAVVHYDAHEPR